ncbi:MAG: hypothetical protein V2G33_07200 [bacterium JZ-2024 1]
MKFGCLRCRYPIADTNIVDLLGGECTVICKRCGLIMKVWWEQVNRIERRLEIRPLNEMEIQDLLYGFKPNGKKKFKEKK